MYICRGDCGTRDTHWFLQLLPEVFVLLLVIPGIRHCLYATRESYFLLIIPTELYKPAIMPLQIFFF